MTRRSLVSLLAAPGKGAPKPEKLQILLGECAHKMGVPSLSAAIIVKGKLFWSGAVGYSDLENRVEASTSSIYRYASISKPISAAMMLRFAESEKLDLDAPAASLCPQLKALPWTVTARQLLGHLGGIRHYRDLSEAQNSTHFSKLSNALAASLLDAQIHQPGARYLYSTRGYTMLGCLAEQISGRPFHQAVNREVLSPAGMKKTRIDHSFELIPNRVRGYFRSQNGELRNAQYLDTSIISPGGGLCGTAEDLARFGVALLNGTLLRSQSLDVMWTSQRLSTGAQTGYGLGWYVAGNGEALRVWHGGAQSGARGLLLLHPPQRAGVALLTNLEYAELRPTARDLLSQVGTTWQEM